VLNATRDKASGSSRIKSYVFYFMRQTVDEELLADDCVRGVFYEDYRANVFRSDAAANNMLVIICYFELIYYR